jgi:hypothetical protein
VVELKSDFPSTILRQRFERARSLALAAQVRECVDYLQNPEVLVQEFMDAHTAVESCSDPSEQRFSVCEPRDRAAAERRALLDQVFGKGPISVFDVVPYEFQCVARDVSSISHGVDRGAQRVDGLDYVGRIIDVDPLAVIGAVQVGVESSPYALFLRLITCLSELAPDAQLRAADESLFKGGLGVEPKIDLHLLLRETDREAATGTLRQLTHDLAETFYAGIAEEWQFPDVLRNIVCLVPAPPGSEEKLIVDWCV